VHGYQMINDGRRRKKKQNEKNINPLFWSKITGIAAVERMQD